MADTTIKERRLADPAMAWRLLRLLEQSRKLEAYWRARCAKAEGRRWLATPPASALLVLLLVSGVWAAGPRVGPGNVLLWNAVTVNEDGSPITDLAGYEVLICPTTPCGPTTAGVVVRNVGLTSTPAAPSVPLSALALGQGQKYAVVRAYDTEGLRGGVSNEAPFDYALSPGRPGNLRVQ